MQLNVIQFQKGTPEEYISWLEVINEVLESAVSLQDDVDEGKVSVNMLPPNYEVNEDTFDKKEERLKVSVFPLNYMEQKVIEPKIEVKCEERNVLFSIFPHYKWCHSDALRRAT